MSLLDGPLERLRRPEYTGENRCFPCTVLNAGIASVASVALAVAWFPGGVLVFTTSLVAIYLRGYLIPGTPTITQRYFPERVLRAFGKEPKQTTRPAGTTSGDAPPSSSDTSPESSADSTRDPANDDGLEAATDEDGERDLELLLTSSGVVEECDDEDDLCLTDGFASAWWRRIREIRDDDESAVSRLAATLDDLDVYIEVLRGREIPWSLYYLGLAVLAGLVQVAVAVEVPLFAALDATASAVFVVTAFGVSAALHYYYGERARLGNLEKPPELRERE